MRGQQDDSVRALEGGPHQTPNLFADSESADTLIVDFPASKSLRNKFLLCMSHPVVWNSVTEVPMDDTFLYSLVKLFVDISVSCLDYMPLESRSLCLGVPGNYFSG